MELDAGKQQLQQIIRLGCLIPFGLFHKETKDRWHNKTMCRMKHHFKRNTTVLYPVYSCHFRHGAIKSMFYTQRVRNGVVVVDHAHLSNGTDHFFETESLPIPGPRFTPELWHSHPIREFTWPIFTSQLYCVQLHKCIMSTTTSMIICWMSFNSIT